MIAFYDYKCETCNRVSEYTTELGTAPKELACANCGEMQHRFYGNNQFLAFSDTSSMYGTYHPGFGCVVEDYAHKQKLLRQYDVQESADASGGSRSYRPEVSTKVTDTPNDVTIGEPIWIDNEEAIEPTLKKESEKVYDNLYRENQ